MINYPVETVINDNWGALFAIAHPSRSCDLIRRTPTSNRQLGGSNHCVVGFSSTKSARCRATLTVNRSLFTGSPSRPRKTEEVCVFGCYNSRKTQNIASQSGGFRMSASMTGATRQLACGSYALLGPLAATRAKKHCLSHGN